MANVMLSSTSSTNPSKPFEIRIKELKCKYSDMLNECVLLFSLDKSRDDGTSLEKKLEEFNLACDELYKEIHRRRERLLSSNEGKMKPQTIQHQLHTAGNLAQIFDDLKSFLENGDSHSSE